MPTATSARGCIAPRGHGQNREGWPFGPPGTHAPGAFPPGRRIVAPPEPSNSPMRDAFLAPWSSNDPVRRRHDRGPPDYVRGRDSQRLKIREAVALFLAKRCDRDVSEAGAVRKKRDPRGGLIAGPSFSRLTREAATYVTTSRTARLARPHRSSSFALGLPSHRRPGGLSHPVW
jgi:hypothetical protein